MYLKSIEIRGFKSFADKTEVQFNSGITSIVGPNGSGKSNISDAVRWVLGEQSAKNLRGGKMEDVIFSGTQFRKPLGLSQVSLLLDNYDNSLPLEYSEVKITRKLFRSGESEYYLNGAQCRLKDIQELFMDTGIGKEGYSIIGQGKIEAVLSGKAEERRGILEEAAGIVKFKARKEEAEKKLNNTEQNLIRLNDILSTYEERLGPLKTESEKAKDFLSLSMELKDKEISLIVYSYGKIKEKLDNSKAGIEEKQAQFNRIREENSSYKSMSNELNSNIEKLELDFNSLNSEYFNKKAENQSLESELNVLEERTQNINKLVEKGTYDACQLEEKLIKVREEKNEQMENKHDIEAKLAKIAEELINEENRVSNREIAVKEKSEKIDRLKAEQFEFISEIANVKNSIALASSESNALMNKKDSLKKSIESFSHSIKSNLSIKESLEVEVCNLLKSIAYLELEYKKNGNEIEVIRKALYENEKEYRQQYSNHNRLEANLSMLVNLEKAYEGYNRAVKTLMLHIDKGNTGVQREKAKILGELIQVPKEYETAIEIVLGGAISDIVTEDEYIAKTLIEYLKANNIGRATFLPLTTVRTRKIEITDKIKKTKGFIDIASNLVDFEPKYKNAVDYILGRTLVAKDMEAALLIAKETNYSYRIVTLSGDVVNTGGSLTGGSINFKATHIFSRKRELEETREKIKEAEESIKKLNSIIEIAKEKISALDKQNSNSREKIHHENIEITKLRGKINALEDEDLKLKNNILITSNEVETVELKLKENKDLSQGVQTQLSLKEEAARQTHDLMQNLELQLKETLEKISETKEELTQIKVNKSAFDEKFFNINSEIQRIINEEKEIVNGKTLLEKEIKNAEKQIQGCIENKSLLKKQLSSSEVAATLLENRLKENELQKLKLKEEISKASNLLEDSQMILAKKEEEIHKAEISLAKNQVELETLLNKLQEEYEYTIEYAVTISKEVDGIENSRGDIIGLKEKISLLGMVNVAAIEEFKELHEKLFFMNGQKQDFSSAKEELQSVINEMTSKMKQVFTENFNKLKINFNDTFKELFKGGSADLILEGDVLEGNVEINVQPPGKRLQNINLLSGGEKGLSAIALLFAILKMKPTPFCLLDEIEAALDDANVMRYAEFLEKFSKDSQFIVITHRKGTMEVSNALYGVTMEEKGVSKIVSVDLKDRVK